MALCLAWAFGAFTPQGLAAAETSEELRIFGYLTQAYGESSAGSIRGATEEGTTDLRNVAVQFRWEKSERDTVVVQLSHEKRGQAPFVPEGDEVEIDWAFYELRIDEQSTLKVGRLNVPLGIYNEVRDVGTLLPFFDLPISFYNGVLSSAETVDGISISRTFAARSQWPLDAELYHGGWDTYQQQLNSEKKFNLESIEARAEDGLGLMLWLETPISGLRLGAGRLNWRLDSPLNEPGTRERWESNHLSLDFTGERWMLRAERRRWRFDQDFGAFLKLGFSLPARAQRDGFYAQLGRWLTPKIGLFGQYDEAKLKNNLGLLPDADDFHTARALSLNYRVRPDLLVKIEYHDADTRIPLGLPVSPMEGGQSPVNVTWTIASLSVSF